MSTHHSNNKSSHKESKVTILVFAMAMGFLISFLCLLLHNKQIYNSISNELSYLVELEDEITVKELKGLKRQLEEVESIFGVEYISKNEAYEMMSSEVKFVNAGLTMDNPFKAHFQFHINAEKSSEDIVLIIEEIKTYAKVSGVFYEEVLIDNIKKILSLLSLVFLGFSIVMLIVNNSLLYSFTKIMLTTNHKEIKTMQLVGAKSSFIKKPYRKSIMRMMMKSIILTMIVILLLVIIAGLYIPSFYTYFNIVYLGISILIVVIWSFFITRFWSNRILDNLLKNELY